MTSTDYDLEQPIFTMVRKADWQVAESVGHYSGSTDDKRDGFLHFSTADQIRVSAQKHRAGETDLLLVAVDPNVLGADLIWEPSRDQALFPHLYANLSVKDAAWVKPLPLGNDGNHVFPELSL